MYRVLIVSAFLGFSVIEKLKEIMSEVEISINSVKEEQRSR